MYFPTGVTNITLFVTLSPKLAKWVSRDTDDMGMHNHSLKNDWYGHWDWKIIYCNKSYIAMNKFAILLVIFCHELLLVEWFPFLKLTLCGQHRASMNSKWVSYINLIRIHRLYMFNLTRCQTFKGYHLVFHIVTYLYWIFLWSMWKLNVLAQCKFLFLYLVSLDFPYAKIMGPGLCRNGHYAGNIRQIMVRFWCIMANIYFNICQKQKLCI